VSLTYAQFVTTVAGLAVITPANADFLAILPNAIDYTELRMQRDLDLLGTISSNTAFSTTANQRAVTVTLGTFVVLENVNIITPTGTSNPNSGTRNPCQPVEKVFLDYTYPNNSTAAVPQYFAMLNQNTIYLGPWPDNQYTVELVATARVTSLSASNTSNLLSLYWPDMYVQAAMVYISQFQRQFGASANDPQMPGSYEAQYQLLKNAAIVEEKAKLFQGPAWSSNEPSPIATPTR
jgi:hypothetical protein